MTRKNKITVILAACAVALPLGAMWLISSNYEPTDVSAEVDVNPVNSAVPKESAQKEQVSDEMAAAFDEFTTTIDEVGVENPDIYNWYAGASIDFPDVNRLRITASFDYHDLSEDQKAEFKKVFTEAWISTLQKHDPDAATSVRFVDPGLKEI